VITFCPRHIIVGERAISTHQTAQWLLPRGDQDAIAKEKISCPYWEQKFNITLTATFRNKICSVAVNLHSEILCSLQHQQFGVNLSNVDTMNDFTHNLHHYLVPAMHGTTVTVCTCGPDGCAFHFPVLTGLDHAKIQQWKPNY
jgi:hypothetical protein